jgi:ABC-type bacteriocin/lantibiotic exporter with double-glycine peptidase domain
MRNLSLILEFKKTFSVYNRTDRKKLALVAFSHVFLAILDLLGVALLGIIGALSVYGIQSQSPSSRILELLRQFNLDQYGFQKQVAILGLIAAIVLIFKTIVSVFIVRKTLLYVSKRGAVLSNELIRNLFSKPVTDVNRYSNQEIIYSATTGIENLTTRVMGSALLMFSDFVLLIVLFTGLIFVNFSITLSIFIIFSLVGLGLNKYMKSSSYQLGTEEAKLGVRSNEKILEVLNSYRELTVKNRKFHYLSEIADLRYNLAEITAKRYFIPNLSKYVFESTLIVGSFLIAGVQFVLHDSSEAISSLAIFLAASSRIAPAILRIQQSSIWLKLGLGTVEDTLEMLNFSKMGDHEDLKSSHKEFVHLDFNPEINVKNLQFKYKSDVDFSVRIPNLNIKPGSQVAITGSSGSGKTTLIDLILGIHNDNSNAVKISGLPPLLAYIKWPGAVAYVPQNIVVMNSTIRENICQGFDVEPSDDWRIWEALNVAHLDKFVNSLPRGLDTSVGEFGNQLSGGQRQRLGIARALFTSPKLLILDEATSALDGETEALISQTIKELKGKCTVILIAHRLSSVMNADKVIFMENGKITAEGTFSEVRKLSPNFEKQVKLMGITDNN